VASDRTMERKNRAVDNAQLSKEKTEKEIPIDK